MLFMRESVSVCVCVCICVSGTEIAKRQIQIQVDRDDNDGRGSVKIMNIVCHLQLFTKRGMSWKERDGGR